MRNKNLRNMFELIDNDLLEEADPIRINAKKRVSSSLFLKITSLVACFLLMLNIAIIVPIGIKLGNQNGNSQVGTDVIEGTGGNTVEKPDNVIINYIQNVTNLQVSKPDGSKNTIKLSSPIIGASSEYDRIVNALEKISDGRIGSIETGKVTQDTNYDDPDEEIEDSMASPEGSEPNRYEETTDLQVQGVIEGDLIKRSDKYIYYLSDSTLMIYPIDQTNPNLIFTENLDDYIDSIDKALEIPKQENQAKVVLDNVEALEQKIVCKELFLSSDCKTVTVVVKILKPLPDYIYGSNAVLLDEDDAIEYTILLSLNVEDPENVYLNNITTLFGEYRESRLVNGEYLVFTEFTPRLKEISVPQYNDGDGFELFPIDKIEVPSEYTTEKYLLAFRLDATTYKVKDLGAYASFDGDIYVSGNNIYLTREYLNEVYYDEAAAPPQTKYETVVNPDGTTEEVIIPDYTGWEQYDGKLYSIKERVTEILKVSYIDGKFQPIGTVKINGYLKDRYSMSENEDKLYAVTTEQTYHYYRAGKRGTQISTTETPRNASIFCIDNTKMVVFSSVLRFAPDGENVRAVKFDGAYAYVCTAVENTDPVFYFNLTDPANIVYSDTGTIPGFSTSLIEYENGILLGIGEDGNENVKVKIYEKDASEVNIIDTYIIDGFCSTDYKSYYINREYGLFGFGIWDYSREDVSRYVMLQIKNGYISEVFNVVLRGDNSSKRVVFIDKYFYLVSRGDYTVVIKEVSKP